MFFVTASVENDDKCMHPSPWNIKCVWNTLHSMPFTRKPWMIEYDIWQVFWLGLCWTPSHYACGVTVVWRFNNVSSEWWEVSKILLIYHSLFTCFYSYGDSAGFTPASLLIPIVRRKPNSVQMCGNSFHLPNFWLHNCGINDKNPCWRGFWRK